MLTSTGSAASAYYSGLVLATVFLATVILLLSIDDLFVDAWFWCRELYLVSRYGGPTGH